MDWTPGGDWGFKEQVDEGNITAPRSLSIPSGELITLAEAAERDRDELMARAVGEHQAYWDGKAPGKVFEHWCFVDGVSS